MYIICILGMKGSHIDLIDASFSFWILHFAYDKFLESVDFYLLLTINFIFSHKGR